MSNTSFKNYVVNYDLVVNSTAAEGFAQVSQMAQRMQKPLKDISNHFKRLQQSASALKKGGAFEVKPTIDVTTFDKQAQSLITRAEKVAAQVNAILNGAFTVNPAAAKTTGKSGTSEKRTPSKTEKRTYTIEQLKKEAEQVKKQIRDLYGPRGYMSENTKGYKNLIESIKGDIGRLENLKKLRTQLAAVNSDIKAASKSGGKITKTITDGVAQGIVSGTKKGSKKLSQQPKVTEAFNGVLQNLIAGKAVQVPISVVSNAQTVESVNAALAKMRNQIKPIVIPITVATNIDAAKAVRSTAEGLQSVITGITPSSTGKKPGGKGTSSTPKTTPVVKTDEQKALEKELKGLQSEQNKYAHWKQRHDEWQKKVAELKKKATNTPTTSISKAEKALLESRLAQIPSEIDNAHKQLVRHKIDHPRLGQFGVISEKTPAGKEYWRLSNIITALKTEKANIESRLASQVVTTPQLKLPAEPVLAEGIRTAEQIEARRAEINQRLQAIGATTPTSETKGKGKGGKKGGRTGGKAGGKGTVPTTPITGTGGIALPISESIAQLQALATEKAIMLNLQMAPITVAQTQLAEQIAALQTLANEKAILLNTTLTPKTTTGKKGRGKAAATGTATAANTIPFEGVVENIVVSKSVKVSGGPVKVEGLVENVKAGKGMRPIELKANIVAPGLNSQVNVLRELSTVWKALPKTGSRTYTVNLKMPGIENIGKLRELAGMVGKLPQSQRRVYNNGIGTGQGKKGVSTTNVYGGSRYTPSRFTSRPRGTMNTFAYQLMGNTSLGARTPVFLDMMKGMGMMTGVGAVMGTLSNAFSNASEYQNTMVTARAILEAGYQGNNFDADFRNMEGIVRDVAKKTKFTAPQAADAARFMAMAGLDIPMINASIRPIADVAVIGDNDLGEVADKITNIQTAFGIKPNKMRALADALTKTFTSSNTDMMMLAESMEYAAPMAHLAGAHVEDALAMIGIMGNAGIQGSMAGTTLRMMYQNVINPNKKQKAMWKKLGISLKDEKGNPRQLMDILGDLRKKVRVTDKDKDEEGKFKDEGTPIATAVSQLFRVTASAGAGTLLENLNKVRALAEANRNAEGLSQRISEVKQNDVKGMMAKMTSAFTDAVVTEFEKQESPIKGYIEKLTKYFNSPDFKNMLHDIFDLVTSMLDMLGHFALAWKKIYDMFGPIIKYTLMAQFMLAQIGYMLAPLRSVYLTIARGAGTLSGLVGGGTAMSASSGIGGTGVMAASGAAPLLSFGSGKVNYNTPAINAARATALRSETALINSRKYLAAATAIDVATTPGIQRSMEKKQMQWWVASQYAGSGPGSRALRSSDNRSARWNLAYNNPQAASELPNRFKIMGAREREIAALQEQLRRRSRNISSAEAAVLANTAFNVNARRTLNSKIADVRHGARRVSPAVLNRAVQMGKIGRLRASGMSLSSGFRTAATWGVTGASAMSLMNGFTSIIGFVGKALGALVNPITLAVAAIGGLSYTLWSVNKKFREQNENWQKQINESGKAINQQLKEAWGANDSISSIFNNINTINVNAASINVENEQKAATSIAKSEEYSSAYEALMGKLFISNDPQTKGFSSIAGISYDTWGAMYDQYVGPMRAVYGNMPDRESFMKMANGNGRMKDQASNAMFVTKAIIGQKAILSDEYKNAEAQIKDLRTRYANLPKDERIAKWSEYQESINSIISQFNPLNKYGLTSITRSNFQTALNATPVQFKEYYEALYNSLQKYSNEAVGMEMVNGLHAFDVGVKENSDAWWDAIGKVVGSFQWSADGDAEHTVFFPMKNGVVQLTQLSEELKGKNYVIVDKVRTYIQNLSAIYDTIYNDPQLNGILGELSKEDFLRHLLHQPNQFSFGGYDPNKQIDNAIDEYFGKQSSIQIPFVTSQSKPSFNWNKLTPWRPSQNDYKNHQSTGTIAQAVAPNIRFDGPLIKIDNIKGGDGVTPEELKNAVAEAVTNTLSYIARPSWQS